MKKTLALFILTVLILSMMLSSCEFLPLDNNGDEIKTAAEALSKMEEVMNGVISYQTTNDVSLSVEMGGEEISMSGDGKTVVMQNAENQVAYFYREVNTRTAYKGVSLTTGSLRLYDEEKYYVLDSRGDYERKIFSSLSIEDFNTYMEENYSDGVNYLEGYSESFYHKNEDGTHSLTLAGFGKEFVDNLNKQLSLTEADNGGVVTDYTVTVEIDQYFFPVKISIDYDFSNTDFSGSEEITFHDIGEAEAIPVSTEEYTLVDDARMPDDLATFISEKKSSKDDYFTFKSTLKVKSPSGSGTYQEQDAVTYGTDENGFFYDVVANVNGTNVKMTYRDGKQTVNGNDDASSEYSDADAMKLIGSLIDPLYYSAVEVSYLEEYKTADGIKYLLYFEPVGNMSDALKSVITSLGVDFVSHSATATVYVKDGEITSYTISARVTGLVQTEIGNRNASVELKYEIDFATKIPAPEENPDL